MYDIPPVCCMCTYVYGHSVHSNYKILDRRAQLHVSIVHGNFPSCPHSDHPHSPSQRVVGGQNVENACGHDLRTWSDSAMQPHVSTAHNNWGQLIFHILITPTALPILLWVIKMRIRMWPRPFGLGLIMQCNHT